MKVVPQVETATAVEFLRNFFAGTKHSIELRALPRKRRVFTRTPTEIAAFLSANHDEDLYFGVATRDGGGDKSHCRELSALFADVDDASENALKRIESFKPEPSLVNFSGGGYHVYWILREPVDPHAPRVEPILKGISKSLGADPACAEIARVLRVPGTVNHKPKYSEPPAVFTLRENWERRYSLDDFADFAGVPTNGSKPSAAPMIADELPEGQRRPALLSMAGTMRRRGAGAEEIHAALVAMNARRCKPPLGEAEVRAIAEDVHSRYQPHAEGSGTTGAKPESPRDDVPPEVVSAEGVTLPDMPDSVLDGFLGEVFQARLKDFPIAFGWLSLLAAAGVLIPGRTSVLRTNLNVALVGPPHCGKTVAIERACFELGVRPPVLEVLKAGSAEGLLAKIGDQRGRSILLFPDELGHLLEKAQITSASFAYVLNSLFYKDEDALTVAHGKQVRFGCRLSIIGGLVDDKFDDAFGSATTGGLYDRFLFGQCPSGFAYLWRPVEGSAAFENEFDEPRVTRDVWEARDAIAKTENLNPRLLEISLRTAFICAAADGRAELRAADLEPAWELARYQSRVRILLEPNAGKNFEGRVAIKILNYLNRHAPDGQWLSLRQVLKQTRAYDFGPSIAEHAVQAMRFGGAVEEQSDTVGKGQKRRLIRLAGECQ